MLIWDKHASSSGICSLLTCLLGGSFYQQAPLRAGATPHYKLPSDADPEEQALNVSSERDSDDGVRDGDRDRNRELYELRRGAGRSPA